MASATQFPSPSADFVLIRGGTVGWHFGVGLPAFFVV